MAVAADEAGKGQASGTHHLPPKRDDLPLLFPLFGVGKHLPYTDVHVIRCVSTAVSFDTWRKLQIIIFL